MAVLPPIALDKINTPDAYEPGYVEDSILKHLIAEYEDNKSLMGNIRDAHAEVRMMVNGWFIRRPADDSTLSDMYVPFVGFNQRTRTNIQMSRLIPDPTRMDWVKVVMTGDFDETVLDRVIQESGDPTMTRQQASEDVANRWTLLLRQALRNSNYLDARWSMSINRRRYGASYGLVDKRWKCVKVSMDTEEGIDALAGEIVSTEMDAAVEEMMGNGFGPTFDGLNADEMSIVPEQVSPSKMDKTRLDFDGLDFVSISPFNIFVGNLACDDGVKALPYVIVFGRKTWRELWDCKLYDDGYAGMYANLEAVPYLSQTEVPTVREMEDDRYGARSQDVGFEVPLRLGKFEAEAVSDFRKVAPKKSEWKRFAKKFGFEYSDLETVEDWAIEWIHPGEYGGTPILLRFQPWHLPVEPGNPSLIVESRYWKIDGRTFAFGDHMSGAAELEILANNGLEDFYRQSERIASPMYATDMSSIDQKYLQENKGVLRFIRDGIIPIRNQPITGQVMTPIAPPIDSVGISQGVINQAQDGIQQYTGVAPQMEGSSSGADSATEAAAQSDYLEQGIRAEMLKEENEIDQPLLRRALAILVEEVNKSGGMDLVARGEDLRLWGDRFREDDMIRMTLTPEMVCSRFGVEILTSSSMGDMNERLTRLERAITMSTTTYQLCMAEGKEPRVSKLLEAYVDELGLPEVFRVLTPQEQQMAQQMMMQQQMGAQPAPTGGAGQARPDYNRMAGETSAPNEPVPGMPLNSATPGVMM